MKIDSLDHPDYYFTIEIEDSEDGEPKYTIMANREEEYTSQDLLELGRWLVQEAKELKRIEK